MIERPIPVSSPVGLVVKQGLNIFSLELRRDADAVIANLDLTDLPRFLVVALRTGSQLSLLLLRLTLGAVYSRFNQIFQQRAGDLLRIQVDKTRGGADNDHASAVWEAGLFRPSAVIGEV